MHYSIDFSESLEDQIRFIARHRLAAAALTEVGFPALFPNDHPFSAAIVGLVPKIITPSRQASG